MQSTKIPKNTTPDPWEVKRRLAALVSIPDIRDPEWEAKALEFVEKYGPLRKPHRSAPRTKRDYALDAVEVAVEFRRVWKPLKECSQSEMEHISIYLDSIFEANDYESWRGSAVQTDYATGKWEPSPRNLLDLLAIQLVRSRKMLSCCQECGKYMVKETSRDYYCSTACSALGGPKKKQEWARKNKEEVNSRRRKPKKGRAA
jgi:hypothetical protein